MYTHTERFILTLVILGLLILGATQLPLLVDSFSERLNNSLSTTRRVTL